MSKNIHAFPRPIGSYAENDNVYYNDSQNGMSLRDYFAAQAMQSFITAYPSTSFPQIALMAYQQADTMLEERTRKQPPPVTSTE